jgi:hypothetical protein
MLNGFKKATKYYPSKRVIAAQVKLKAALKSGAASDSQDETGLPQTLQ